MKQALQGANGRPFSSDLLTVLTTYWDSSGWRLRNWERLILVSIRVAMTPASIARQDRKEETAQNKIPTQATAATATATEIGNATRLGLLAGWTWSCRCKRTAVASMVPWWVFLFPRKTVVTSLLGKMPIAVVIFPAWVWYRSLPYALIFSISCIPIIAMISRELSSQVSTTNSDVFPL